MKKQQIKFRNFKIEIIKNSIDDFDYKIFDLFNNLIYISDNIYTTFSGALKSAKYEIYYNN